MMRQDVSSSTCVEEEDGGDGLLRNLVIFKQRGLGDDADEGDSQPPVSFVDYVIGKAVQAEEAAEEDAKKQKHAKKQQLAAAEKKKKQSKIMTAAKTMATKNDESKGGAASSSSSGFFQSMRRQGMTEADHQIIQAGVSTDPVNASKDDTIRKRLNAARKATQKKPAANQAYDDDDSNKKMNKKANKKSAADPSKAFQLRRIRGKSSEKNNKKKPAPAIQKKPAARVMMQHSFWDACSKRFNPERLFLRRQRVCFGVFLK